jgi:chorismate dehydratase
MHGPQRGVFDLEFALPSECARQLRARESDIGIVPVAALLDEDYAIYRGAGIACRGAVRTILLISKVPFGEIRSLATDAGSRTSVLLSRIILARRYGVTNPECVSMPASLETMLEAADACLIIGDPALRLEPEVLRQQGFQVADLGQEWFDLTGLPMVFAVWAGPASVITPEREAAFVDSYRYGKDHLEDIVRVEHEVRGFTPEAVREYLTRYIVFELGEAEYEGMQTYLRYASELLASAATAPAATANHS